MYVQFRTLIIANEKPRLLQNFAIIEVLSKCLFTIFKNTVSTILSDLNRTKSSA